MNRVSKRALWFLLFKRKSSNRFIFVNHVTVALILPPVIWLNGTGGGYCSALHSWLL